MHIQTSDQETSDLGFFGYSCNWGTHICGLYETEEERDEILLGFLNAGDMGGDLQLYCPVERTRENFIETYEEKFPQCHGHTEDETIFRLYGTRELYYPDGFFSPDAMDEGLDNFFDMSQKSGKRNIRASAEMVWALEKIPGVEHLMVYEARLNNFIFQKPWISICLYNITKFSGSIIMKVLQTHPFAISKGKLTQNPYYIEPDIWLKEYAPSLRNRETR